MRIISASLVLTAAADEEGKFIDRLLNTMRWCFFLFLFFIVDSSREEFQNCRRFLFLFLVRQRNIKFKNDWSKHWFHFFFFKHFTANIFLGQTFQHEVLRKKIHTRLVVIAETQTLPHVVFHISRLHFFKYEERRKPSKILGWGISGQKEREKMLRRDMFMLDE